MAEEPAPADRPAEPGDDSRAHAPEMSLTDLIDQIERAAFERTLDGRHGTTHEAQDG